MVPSATLTIRTGTPNDLPSFVAIDTFAKSHSERVEFLRQSLALAQCVVAVSETEPTGFAILNYDSREAAIDGAKRFLEVAGDGECISYQIDEGQH